MHTSERNNMAYTTEELEEMCLEAIEEHKIKFFSWLDRYITPSLSTLKERKLAQSPTIKKALNYWRIERLERIDALTEKTDNPALIIAEKKVLYRVMGDEDMLDALTGTQRHVDNDKETTEYDIVDGLYSEAHYSQTPSFSVALFILRCETSGG